MKCFYCIDYSLLTSIIPIIVALIAVIIAMFVGFITTRYQIISLLNTQLADKAKDCNSNLNHNDLSKMPKQNDKVSWIVSSIITAEEIINYQLYYSKRFFLVGYNIQELIDEFYLQLHTTIRVFFQKERFDSSDLEDKSQFDVIEKQYTRAKEFLLILIKNDENKAFEKLLL